MTAFGTHVAKVEQVALMRKYGDKNIAIKASGVKSVDEFVAKN